MKQVHASVIIVLSLLSTAAIAQELSVTVYNNNLGVISEIRDLSFEKGIGTLAFRDVPSAIDAASVRFKLVDSPGRVSILEQNYAYDLVSPEQLYGKYIDQRIELIDNDGRLFSGNLLAFSSGALTLMDESGRVRIVSLKNFTEVNFPQLPDGLITRPTLFWRYSSKTSGSFKSRVSYQTAGMSWSAEYVGVLDKDDKILDLSGWASITNNSGKTYPNAKLKLVAGDINRAQPPVFRGGRGDVMYAPLATNGLGGFVEKAFFEYHMYTLPRSSTLANKEIKQVSLFEPAEGSVEKVYLYRPERDPKSVSVVVKFINSKENGLGMPLPGGRVRLFKADDDGSLILLGEDRIKHTPRNEELKLTVGNAFDIVAEHKLASQSRVSGTIEDRVFEIEIRNRKDEAITVQVEKKLFGFWEITESSHEYKKKDATTVLFDIPVPAGEKALLKLKVRYTHR